MNLTDMQLTPEEAKEVAGCCSSDGEAEGPKYPWGLSISLDDTTLEKLGISALPQVGQRMQLAAVVEVCSTSQHENQEGMDKCVSLQIIKLGLEGERPNPATVLYG
ncbi:capsid staple protein [Achromobacter xylosoxidans]|uniref:capsid staple protein n=1 Tax=Alcaligenes xylosoxydans xylosoxydans TaxID=85698 RepID=UPI001EEDAF0F|nr:hypothetical protein [Achromobacter xylosoxidans]